MENEFKVCPYCGEKIRKEAQKCRHCGEWLTEEPPLQKKEVEQDSTEQVVSKKSPLQSIAIGCLFLLIFYGGIAGIILIVAHLTIPSDERMERAIIKDVQACVEDKAVSVSGLFGEEASALTSMFLATDASAQSINENYQKYNATVIKRSWFWSVGKIYNCNSPNGVNVCFGMFGIVIPYVDWEDFALTDSGKGAYERTNTE